MVLKFIIQTLLTFIFKLYIAGAASEPSQLPHGHNLEVSLHSCLLPTCRSCCFNCQWLLPVLFQKVFCSPICRYGLLCIVILENKQTLMRNKANNVLPLFNLSISYNLESFFSPRCFYSPVYIFLQFWNFSYTGSETSHTHAAYSLCTQENMKQRRFMKKNYYCEMLFRFVPNFICIYKYILIYLVFSKKTPVKILEGI